MKLKIQIVYYKISSDINSEVDSKRTSNQPYTMREYTNYAGIVFARAS